MKRHSIPQSGQSSASGVLGPQTEKDHVCVNACAPKSKEIKETMRGTVAASGRDGWGTQHNTTVLSLIQNTDTERQPTRINSTCCVCYEGDCASERRTDRGACGGPKREKEGAVQLVFYLAADGDDKTSPDTSRRRGLTAHTDSTGLCHEL